jgi:signal transduction histidine kinase
MMQTTERKPYHAPPNTTAEYLMSNRNRILSMWVARVKQAIQAAKTERDPIVVDTIPTLLENLAQALDEKFPRSLATEGTTIASEHGGERARVTRFPPGEVIKEFQILRDVVFEVLSEPKTLSNREIDIIIKSIDQAMSESLTAYFLVHQGIREQFVAMLTHDLRNPLSAIRASADLMRLNPDRKEQMSVLTGRIAENTRRVDQMIQDLLDASRVQFGERIHFEVEQGELYSMLRDALTHLAAIYGDRFILDGKPVHGYWNMDAFRRAVENIVTNAVKYGDPAKKITIHLEEIKGRVVVSVHNEGSYIPPEEQENLFRSFIRSKSAQAGTKRGWGLGLAMARGMAEGHGGSITVDSSPERGTSFIIDVPADTRAHINHPMTPGSSKLKG